jgi:glycosyltransferase involved in cell wall biosynthesis
MRILYHHRTLGDGAEGIHVSSIVQAFRQLGHDVKVAALIGEQTNVVTKRSRRIKALLGLAPRVIYELIELGYTIAGYRLLKGTASEWKPDLLYERYALFNFAGLQFARRQNIPFVLEVNAPLAYERTNYEELVLKRLARRCERVICSKANLVVVVSTPLKEYLVEQGVPGQQIRVLPNGADVELFHPGEAMRKIVRSRLGVSDETVVIGFVGILRPWHGIETLCAAIYDRKIRRCILSLSETVPAAKILSG